MEAMVVYLPTPLKNDGVKVSWAYTIPNMKRKIKAMLQTTNQSLITINQHHYPLLSMINHN
jgi:hypothetical protein